MVEFLDGVEEDPDLEEPADDEPSLGWTTIGLQCGHCGGTDDLEAEPEHAEPDLCDEPSLGALEGHTDQSRWGQSSLPDREADGTEPGIADQEGLV